MTWAGKHSAEGALTALSQSGLNETSPNLPLTSIGTSPPLSALSADRIQLLVSVLVG